ncbi:conserved hypothetical protein [Streptomyces pristinaespiralis ATCC 25486]|uniref:Uncharacterized protein n=1 Tax=Streptomyces pristinaespiralis (strain ATCC 25486 / DSM 40338 / CBS 914.69 / JCM 4507 / KCC S-0507 / NBRC 13074 / NRRL 2958 / 5647) TaxID=457429 RepID=B5HD50_STRE2|nr:conserved hypothetical protein [Streptomyces pristinaespiralis ATCC 25486]
MRSDRGVPTLPKTRSYPVRGRSALLSHALSLEFSAYAALAGTCGQPAPPLSPSRSVSEWCSGT